MIYLARSAVAALALTGLFLGQAAAGSDAEPDGWVVVLLLDRSPSTVSKPIDEYAAKLREQVTGWARFQDVPLHFTSANFGKQIGGPPQLSLVKVDKPAVPALPKRETIPYTDFRAAFARALEISRQSAEHSRMLVVLVTDAEPWITRSRMTKKQKEEYFQKSRSFGSVRDISVEGALRDIQKDKGVVVVVAIGDLADDARLWRRYIPQRHYISTRETPDPLGEVRSILSGLVYEGPTIRTPEEAVVEDQNQAQAVVIPSSPWLWAAGGAVSAFILAALLLVVLKSRSGAAGAPQDLRAIDEQAETSGQPQQLRVLEEQARSLTEEAGILSQSKREDVRARGLDLYKEAMAKGEVVCKEGREIGEDIQSCGIRLISEAASGIFANYCKTPEEARNLIVEMLEDGTKERARGIAPALIERWKIAPEFLLDEFDLFRMKPLGKSLLDGLAELDQDEQDDLTKSIVSLALFSRELADMTEVMV